MDPQLPAERKAPAPCTNAPLRQQTLCVRSVEPLRVTRQRPNGTRRRRHLRLAFAEAIEESETPLDIARGISVYTVAQGVAVGKKTIYVKNEELWERAKSIAGVDGLSRLVEAALEGVVTAKQLQQQGLERYNLRVEPILDFTPDVKETLAFDGECLVAREWPSVSVYRTKGGKFIVTDNLVSDGSITAYRTYETLYALKEELEALDQKDAAGGLWDAVCEAMPPSETITWID